MKFLCVNCNVQMTLEKSRGPDDGSLSVVFGCSSCGRKIAMLTNSEETQVLHSLGIKIAASEKEAAPMETNRSSPMDNPGAAESLESAKADPTDKTSGGAIDAQSELQWTPEALERMDRIPAFVRGMVQKGIEDYARANDITRVDEAVLKDVRDGFGF